MVHRASFRSPILVFALALLSTVSLVCAGCNSDDSGSAPDVTPPGTITQLNATVQASSVHLVWINPNDPDFDGVQVRRGENAAPTDSTGTLVFDGMASSFTDNTIVPGADYIYAVFAYDAAGNISAPVVKAVATSAPTPVVFNDSELEAIIRDLLSKPTGDILATDMLALTEIDASHSSVGDLEGLQYCLNLTKLNAQFADLTDASHLAVLSNLDKLYELDLRDNAITTIPDLTGLPMLHTLYLEGNELTSLSPLAGMPTLNLLRAGGTTLSDLSPLSGITTLRTVQIFDSAVVDLAPLAGLPDLTTLGIFNSPLSDLTPLASLTGLQTLQLVQTEISDLGPVTGLINLTYIQIPQNHLLHELQPLVDNTGLGPNCTLIAGQCPLLHDAVAVQLPALEARGVEVLPMTGLPVDMVGRWEIDNITVDGTPVSDLATFFDWSPGTVTTHLTLYYNYTYAVDDLNAADEALYTETGTANVSGDQLTLTELTEDGQPVSDGEVMTATWEMVGDDPGW